MVLSDSLLSESTFIEVVSFAVISIIVAQLWLTVLNNFMFNSLGLSEMSWYVSAVVGVFIFIFFLYLLEYNPQILRPNRVVPLTI